jgi:flagellar M-ring protein FliF
LATDYYGAIEKIAKGFLHLPLMRQVGLWFGLAASVAIGIYAVRWSVAPHYLPLYTALEPKEIGQITEALDKVQLQYQFHPGSGGILVPAEKVHETRMRLSALGLPKKGPVGFEIMDENKAFMESHFSEFIRYRRGLEGELSRTLSHLSFVRNARVHLGLTKESSFIKKKNISSASVVLDIVGGKTLNPDQIRGIVHLVSSSVPGLSKEAVSVVDQNGTLLSASIKESLIGSIDTLRHRQQVEKLYVNRIQALLAPIVGEQGVRAEVTADLDFSSMDEMQERFDPGHVVVRSENILTERKGKKEESGIPGAYSNQPSFIKKQETAEAKEMPQQNHFRDQSTRNFEVDKSVIHLKHPAGRVSRLSVAVVIDDKNIEGIGGDLTVEKIESLVKHAVGFQAERGDTLSVVYTPFISKNTQEDIVEKIPFYENPMTILLLKPLIVVALGIWAILMVFKPVFIRLTRLSTQEQSVSSAKTEEAAMFEKNQALLRKRQAADILPILENEHPQVQAMILSYLTTEQSAALMLQLPEEVRLDLMARLANLSSITPEAQKAFSIMIERALCGNP